jgi:hypothetical protein
LASDQPRSKTKKRFIEIKRTSRGNRSQYFFPNTQNEQTCISFQAN